MLERNLKVLHVTFSAWWIKQVGTLLPAMTLGQASGSTGMRQELQHFDSDLGISTHQAPGWATLLPDIRPAMPPGVRLPDSSYGVEAPSAKPCRVPSMQASDLYLEILACTTSPYPVPTQSARFGNTLQAGFECSIKGGRTTAAGAVALPAMSHVSPSEG